MARLLRRRIRRILIDIDTQYDLLAQCNGDQSQLLRRIRRLMAWARVESIPVVSTALARPGSTTNNVSLLGSPIQCIEGTPGQQKIGYTMLPHQIWFGPENRLDLPRRLLSDYQQIIFEKRTDDPFTQPRADRLLTEAKMDEYIVFGMGLEKAIRATVLGLLNRRKRVLVVTDAVDDAEVRSGYMALRHVEAKGARLVLTDDLTGPSRLVGKAALKKPSTSNNNHPRH
ncbi:isochorismatase family protein [Planctomycetota bacterium]